MYAASWWWALQPQLKKSWSRGSWNSMVVQKRWVKRGSWLVKSEWEMQEVHREAMQGRERLSLTVVLAPGSFPFPTAVQGLLCRISYLWISMCLPVRCYATSPQSWATSVSVPLGRQENLNLDIHHYETTKANDSPKGLLTDTDSSYSWITLAFALRCRPPICKTRNLKVQSLAPSGIFHDEKVSLNTVFFFLFTCYRCALQHWSHVLYTWLNHIFPQKYSPELEYK